MVMFFLARRNPNRTEDARRKQSSRDVIPFMTREELEREREKKRGISEVLFGEAREAVLLHLNRIERMRPLDSIKEDQHRDRAFGVRRWFKDQFCGVLNGLD